MRFRDPVCGMTVVWEEARDFEVADYGIVYFCCAGCAGRFREQHRSDASRTLPHRDEVRHTCRDTSGIMPLIIARVLAGESLVMDFRPLEQIPQIGGVALDNLEHRVAAEWRRRLGYAADTHCVCRTMERALLSLGLEEGVRERTHEIELILAAETARLRMNLLDRDRVSRELRRLPAALSTVLSRTALTPLRRDRIVSRVAREIPSIIRSVEYRPPSSEARWAQDTPTTHGDTTDRSQSQSHGRARERPPGRHS